MKPANDIRRDGSINPGAYDIVDGCHIWKWSLEDGRPVTPKDGQRVFIRHWVMRAERGRRIRATCRNDRCINPDHLVIEATVYEISAERLGRLPAGALPAYDRDLLERRARGQSTREIAADLGVSIGNARYRIGIADRQLF